MIDLFSTSQQNSGPVECLGQTFPSDEVRREHYLKLLAEKLKDPEFRKIEGFPIGSDEDILALSDPPYYTACPNPFIENFIRHYGKSYDSSVPYLREPFFADVSEGKYDPLYKLHPYHTKVPHRAIMRYILQYTEPGDLVQDAFAGSGATGVAAQLCGNKAVVESLGYKVDSNGVVYREEIVDGKESWLPFSKIGARKAILSDLSPVAGFISYIYNTPSDPISFQHDAQRILRATEDKYGWMFQTAHSPTNDQIQLAVEEINSKDTPNLGKFCAVGRVNYTVWSDVFTCPECAGDVVFWNTAVDIEGGKVNDQFSCPSCAASLTKRSMERKWQKMMDPYLGHIVEQAVQVPVMINYKVGKKRFQKIPDQADVALILKTESLRAGEWCPTFPLPTGFNTRQPIESHGLTHIHHFYTGRNRIALAAFNALCEHPLLKSLVTTVAFRITKRYGLTYQAGTWGAGGGPTNGTLYIPSLVKELNMFEMLDNAVSKSESKTDINELNAILSTQSTQGLKLPPNSIDYAFIDPPFGANIMYSELNALWEGWIGALTDTKAEAIESKAQSKSLNDYRKMMADALINVYEALKPGRWVTIEFSNTQASVWNAIQTSLQEAGFVVANVAALDKQKGSFKAITTTTAVKQDLVISAYKPNGGLEDRFSQSGGTEESVWDFVRTHLKYLPVVKAKRDELEFIAERDPRIIFDRMVAWFVRHNAPVPMSTHEFQSGLYQRFVERDGMIFLPDQVTEYDKKRMQVAIAPQMEMFVSDERSAIDWLTDFLKRRPSTYQEVHTDFISQLGAGWKKHESKPELAALLEDNFIQYDGTGDVPSQIHSYLSTNHKDLRGLEKNSPALVAKAKERWYVPDPNKAQDLEKKREKALLKEFDQYRAFTGRRLKEFRLEALRAGFRTAWGNKDYQTIIDIAAKVPDAALQEDEKLLTLYDLALTRTEDGI
ncbi:DNA methyltransferase [Alcaligenes sp. SJTW-7]|uniref:DNA methyltransferase n=1 Tax=Alcaligenes sp. SJTW-7 TaxID=3078429 RepID=UPI0039E99081